MFCVMPWILKMLLGKGLWKRKDFDCQELFPASIGGDSLGSPT